MGEHRTILREFHIPPHHPPSPPVTTGHQATSMAVFDLDLVFKGISLLCCILRAAFRVILALPFALLRCAAIDCGIKWPEPAGTCSFYEGTVQHSRSKPTRHQFTCAILAIFLETNRHLFQHHVPIAPCSRCTSKHPSIEHMDEETFVWLERVHFTSPDVIGTMICTLAVHPTLMCKSLSVHKHNCCSPRDSRTYSGHFFRIHRFYNTDTSHKLHGADELMGNIDRQVPSPNGSHRPGRSTSVVLRSEPRSHDC